MKLKGFRNKLCVLLSGPPGTGKSSTIDVVGSYLEKDIYYINLKNVSCDEKSSPNAAGGGRCVPY